MSFTSTFSPATRVYVACFLAIIIFILLGGLASSVHEHGSLTTTMSDGAPTPGWSRAVSSKNVAQYKPKISWDQVRILRCSLTWIADSIRYCIIKITPEKKLNWHECFPGRQCARLIVCAQLPPRRVGKWYDCFILGPSKLLRSTRCRSYHCSHSQTFRFCRIIAWIQRAYSFQSRRPRRKRRGIYTSIWR